LLLFILSFHIYVSWDQLEPTEGVYNWTLIDNQIFGMRAHGILSGIQFLVGRNAPPWLMTLCGTFLTTNTSAQNMGPYPCYLEPRCSYNASVIKLIQATGDYFHAHWSTIGPAQILYWHLSEGTTGDEFAYHGDPVSDGVDTTLPPCGRVGYSIDRGVWSNFRYYLWDVGAKANAQNEAWLKLLMNPSSDLSDLDKLWQISPSAYVKDGLLSHQYGFNSEVPTVNRISVTVHDDFISRRSRGEFQDTYLLAEWHYAPIKNTWALFASALNGGLDMLEWGASLFTDNTPDTRPLFFFDKYAPLRNPDAPGSSRGFLVFRDIIDLADTTRFPEATYGALINPAKTGAYNSAMATAAATAGPVYYPMRVSKITETYLNPARATAIKNDYLLPGGKFFGVGAMDALASNANNMTFGDFGVNVTYNYAKFIQQLNVAASSVGRFRCGGGNTIFTLPATDSEMHGRYCREFNLAQSPEMLFAVHPGLGCNAGPSNNVWLNLTYYDDSAGGSFQVFYSSSAGRKAAGAVITKTGTKTWITANHNVADFELGGKLAAQTLRSNTWVAAILSLG
jgi:hypothetical protein